MKKGAINAAGTGGTNTLDGAGGQAAALAPGVEQATCRPESAELVSMAAQTSGQSQASALQAAAGATH